MHILLVARWDQEFGGVTSVVGNLARYLQNQGHTVSFLYPDKMVLLKPTVTKWGFPGFRLRLQLPSLNHWGAGLLAFVCLFPLTLYQLVRLIKKERIQVVNVHYPMDDCFYFAFCRWLLPLKLVTAIHGADIFPRGKPRRKYSYAIKLLFRTSDL